MRRKIWRMSEGQFTYTVPKTYLEPEIINETIVEGEVFDGSFSVTCDKSSPTKGLVYCDHPYIYINTPAFNENNSEISYRVSAVNLRAKDEITGDFYIYSESSAKKLPFTIKVVKRYPNSSYGKITSIEDFAELCKRSWKEAKEIFYTKEFEDLMYESSDNLRLLYRGFKDAARSDANLEEFLAASGVKERVYFDLDTSKREYSFVGGNIKESIDITRNTWGYIKIDVKSDKDFISIENNTLTNDFFLGSKLSFNFYIHKEKLHAGKNYGRITFSGMGIKRQVDIVASTKDIYEKTNEEKITYKKNFLLLYKTYEDFRLKKIDSITWAGRTKEAIDSLLNGPVEDRNFYRLIKTHALIVEGNRQAALELIKNLRIDIIDKRSANWAYLLYLGALLEPDEEYVARLRKEIEVIQDLYPEDIRIFWFLLFLKKEYLRDNSEKLRAIKHWISEGYDSPVLFAECYEIFLEDTYLLDSFSDFNLKIITWACKNNGLNSIIADRLFDLLLKESGFNKRIYRILLESYEYSKNELHLKHLISYMLKGNAKGEEFSPMYKMGIEANLKLTGLFEAYVESLPLNNIEQLNDITLRYFSYNSNIPVERKALVYANIIIHKDDSPAIYESFKGTIAAFCIEQMKSKRIDDNLCVCYQDMLENGIPDSKIAENISNIIFAKKVICMHPLAKRVKIIEDSIKSPLRSEFIGNLSFVPVYSVDYKVFIELGDGNLSVDENLFYLENTINADESINNLKHLAMDKKCYFLRDLSEVDKTGSIDDIYEEEAISFLFDESVDPYYLKTHFQPFMSFFRDHLREDIILDALMHELRYREYDVSILTYFVNLLIIDKEYDKAIEVLEQNLLLNVDRRQLLNCLNVFVEDGTRSKGEFVLELCVYLLRDGYHSDETIEYLLHHFIGRPEDMRLIFKYAQPTSEALGGFCERFIVQGLYSGTITTSDDNILISYLENRANPMIVEAYISYFSHQYLCEDIMPPESVFAILLRQLKLTDSINDTCRFAYAKYLCKKNELSANEEEMLDILLSDLLTRNIYFAFFQDMNEEFITKYHLYDRMYISMEYVPHKDLVISVKIGNEKLDMDMNESYAGIYVKDLVIFFGETVYYDIYERNNPSVSIYSGEYSYQDFGYLKESRFYQINRMGENTFFKDTSRLRENILDYEKKTFAAKEIFKTL